MSAELDYIASAEAGHDVWRAEQRRDVVRAVQHGRRIIEELPYEPPTRPSWRPDWVAWFWLLVIAGLFVWVFVAATG